MRAYLVPLVFGMLFPVTVVAQVSEALAAAVSAFEAAASASASAFLSCAAANASVAAEKAKFGPLGSKDVPGSVEVGANSGKFEAALLASESISRMADQIGNAIATTPGKTADSTLLIVTSTETPTFEGYDSFSQRVEQLGLEFAKAKVTEAKPKPKAGKGKGTPAVQASSAAVALDVIGNLFRSDYKVAALDVTTDDVLLVRALSGVTSNAWTVRVPAYSPTASGQDNPAVVGLNKVLDDRTAALDLLRKAKSDATAQPTLDYSDRIAALEGFIKAAEAFSSEMRTAVAGVVPFVVIARQAQLKQQLEGGYLLCVKVHTAGGSSVAKKNFWTFLGSMPFKVSGGALASYSLLEGSTGRVLRAGTLADMQPLKKLSEISISAAD